MKQNQNGFALIELLLIILIIAIIGFGGYYVYHTNHKSTTSNLKTTSDTTTKYFTISQWGVRAPYDGNLTLEYSMAFSNQDAYLSSKQLDNSGPNCSETPLQYGGAIQRLPSNQDVQNEDGSSTGMTPAQFFSQSDISSTSYFSHVGSYWYWYNPPQAACGTSTSSQSIQSQTDSVFKSLVSKFTSVN